MFPFIQSLVVSLYAICNKYVIPCTSHAAWQRENRHLNKKTFIKVTSCIRADVEKIGRIFQNFHKTKEDLKSRVLAEQKNTKKFQLSCDSIRATLTRERSNLQAKFDEKELEYENGRKLLEDENLNLSRELENLHEILSQKSEELENVQKICAEKSETSDREKDRRQLIQSSLNELENKFSDLTAQLKESKLANNKMKTKLIQLSGKCSKNFSHLGDSKFSIFLIFRFVGIFEHFFPTDMKRESFVK